MYQQTAICCTLNNVPMSAKALQKSRLPFGVHLYPFAYDEDIPVCQDGLIVRCAMCRAYINPYVRICEQGSWQCNLCNRLNELPNQFVYDYSKGEYYDLGSKMELNSETMEYVAGVEYMVRPPQPACYMFVFDCSKAAIEMGYIPIMASAIIDLIDQLPGDARASVGFIAFDSNINYFSFSGTKVIHYVWPDVSSITPPCPSDGLLVNIKAKREMIIDFLNERLTEYSTEDSVTKSALGPAIKAAVKILAPIGGKITVLLGQLPNHGCPDDGSILEPREAMNRGKNPPMDKNGESLTPLLNPASDYYKNIALECCDHQISIDLFNLSTTYVDLATLSPLSKFSAGSIFHYANSASENKTTLIRFDHDFRNHLVRPIGLESVLRLRFTRGLKIHTFHGNFFVRSPNLLVLPNANPDASYALQIEFEDDLKPDTRFVYFQASILYTTPDGERRIRVHTARYPTVTTLPEVIYGANQTAIVALLAKMAVDRSMKASIGEAKEALIGSGVDLLEIYSIADELRARSYAMSLPENLRSIPLYLLALLKHIALMLSAPIKLDDRYAAMERFKTLPVDDLITYIYPDLYPLHDIANDQNNEWKNPIQLTAAHIERHGAYLLDAYDVMIIYIGQEIDPSWCHYVLGVSDYSRIVEHHDVIRDNQNHIRPRDPSNFLPQTSFQDPRHFLPAHQTLTASEVAESSLIKLPELENQISVKLRDYINYLIDSRPQNPKFYILKENSKARHLFTQYLIDDRSDSYHSYPEFWKFLQDQACK